VVTTGGIAVTKTSGSTGEPVSHLKTGDESQFWRVVLWTRLFRDLRLPRFGNIYDLGLHWSGQPIIEPRLLPGAYLAWNFRAYSLDDPNLTDEFLAILGVARPTVIYGAPSRICNLVRVCQEFNITIRPRVVLSSFEQLSDLDRNLIQKTFDARVVSVYGTAELGTCGWECASGRIHFEEDSVIPEVVTDEGKPTSAGDVGKLIVTSLKSWAMPLVRYETGDLALVPKRSCDCGQSSPSIMRIEGRHGVSIFTKTGRQFSSYQILSLVQSLGLPDYQVVQTTAGSLEVRFPKQTNISVAAFQRLERRIAEYLGEPMHVTICTGEFLLEESGKRNPVVQRIPR